MHTIIVVLSGSTKANCVSIVTLTVSFNDQSNQNAKSDFVNLCSLHYYCVICK